MVKNNWFSNNMVNIVKYQIQATIKFGRKVANTCTESRAKTLVLSLPSYKQKGSEFYTLQCRTSDLFVQFGKAINIFQEI